MPKCAKCNYIIKEDFSTCNSCNKTYHSGWTYQQVYNTASGMPSGPQTPLFSFSSEPTLPQQHLQAASVSGVSATLLPQHQQTAATSVSVSSVPVQQIQHHHPQTTTVSDEMALFNTLDSDAKMARMYEFMFTNMRGLESRLNEVARTTSERFSQVDARLQALEQRAVEQTFRPYESTVEIVVSGLPTRGQLTYEEIVNRIFNFIGATRFLGDIISIRKLKALKEKGSSSTTNGDNAVLMSYSLILRFKSVQVRNEVMRLKIVKGNIHVVTIFPDLPNLAENKVFLNEFLPKEELALLRLVRARAKARNYERVWVRNEQIFVRKSSHSDIISITSESDLNKLI